MTFEAQQLLLCYKTAVGTGVKSWVVYVRMEAVNSLGFVSQTSLSVQSTLIEEYFLFWGVSSIAATTDSAQGQTGAVVWLCLCVAHCKARPCRETAMGWCWVCP